MLIALYFIVIVLLCIVYAALWARFAKLHFVPVVKWIIVVIGLLPVAGLWAWRIHLLEDWRRLGISNAMYAIESLAVFVVVAGSTLLWILACRRNNWFGRRSTWQYVLCFAILLGLAPALSRWMDSRVAELGMETLANANAEIARLLPAPIAEKDNAATNYQQFAKASEPFAGETSLSDLYDSDQRMDDPAFARAIEARKSLLIFARQAADMPGFYVHHVPADIRMDNDRPELLQLRRVAEELSYNSRWEARAGDVDSAIADANRIYAVNKHARSLEGVIGYLVCGGLRALGDRTLFDVLPAVKTLPQLRRISISEMPSEDDLVRAMKMQNWIDQKSVVQMFDGIPTLKCVFLGDTTWSRTAFTRTLALLQKGNDLTLKSLTLPAGREAVVMQPAFDELGTTHNPMALLAISMHATIGGARTSSQISRNAVLVAIAQTHYRLDHGSYTADPAKLVPAYLPAMPIDLYDGKPMKIALENDGTLFIYSVGKDGRDNGAYLLNNPKDIPAGTDDVGNFMKLPAKH